MSPVQTLTGLRLVALVVWVSQTLLMFADNPVTGQHNQARYGTMLTPPGWPPPGRGGVAGAGGSAHRWCLRHRAGSAPWPRLRSRPAGAGVAAIRAMARPPARAGTGSARAAGR